MHDFFVPGIVDIDWRRFYSTASEANSWLGRGWTVRYFMTLEQVADGYLLIDEEGASILFPTDAPLETEGETIVNIGARMELQRQKDHFEILHWHHGSDSIMRFRFAAGPGRMP